MQDEAGPAEVAAVDLETVVAQPEEDPANSTGAVATTEAVEVAVAAAADPAPQSEPAAAEPTSADLYSDPATVTVEAAETTAADASEPLVAPATATVEAVGTVAANDPEPESEATAAEPASTNHVSVTELVPAEAAGDPQATEALEDVEPNESKIAAADTMTTMPGEYATFAPEQPSTALPAAQPVVQKRLFIGSVPPTLTEADLRPYFTETGDVKDITVLRDRMTGMSKGCAFVVYDTEAEAQAAIERYDRKVVLAGGSYPMEVRYAKDSGNVMPTSAPTDSCQLFFARAPPGVTEETVRAAFSEFGQVQEVQCFQDRAAGTTKGCGFVYMSTRDEAQACINGMDGKTQIQGSYAPLAVKWADPDLPNKKRKAVYDANADNRQIFFARVPRTVSEGELRAAVEPIAPVAEVVLFKSHGGAVESKGCGILTFHSHEDAERVLAQLDHRHTFAGMDMPMVLKWVDQDLQKRRRQEHGGPGGPGFGPGVPPMQQGPGSWGAQPSYRPTPAGYGPPVNYAPPPAYGPPASYGGGGYASPDVAGQPERPPPGCDPDCFKLYVANIPHALRAEDLTPVIQRHGQVIEFNIARDKMTQASRGVGFLWMRTRAQCEATLAGLNGTIVDDGAGNARTLAVTIARRKPRPGVPGQGPGYTSPQQGQQPAPGQYGGYATQAPAGYGPPAQAPAYATQPAQQQQYYAPPAAQDPYAAQAQYYNQYQQPQAAAPAPVQQAGAYNGYAAPAGQYAQPAYQQPAPAAYQTPQAYAAPQAAGSYQQPQAYAAAAPAGQPGYAAPAAAQPAAAQYAAPAASGAQAQQQAYAAYYQQQGQAAQPAAAQQYAYPPPQ